MISEFRENRKLSRNCEAGNGKPDPFIADERPGNQRFPGLVQPDGIHKDFVVLKMTGETTKTQVFRALAESGLDVESFGDYRPSLNDIFVERAGDEA